MLNQNPLRIFVAVFALGSITLSVAGLSVWAFSDEKRQVPDAQGKQAEIVKNQIPQKTENESVDISSTALLRKSDRQQIADYDLNQNLQHAEPLALDSLPSLIAHFEATDAELIDFDAVLRMINASDSAFDYIVEQHVSLNHDEAKQRVLLNALNNTTNPSRVDVALELVNSPELVLRKQAYSWLSQSDGNELAHQALVDASYHEHKPKALAQLVSLMPAQESLQSPDLFDRVIRRLTELSFHPEIRVSSEAIEKIAQSAITENTLNILHLHLQDSSTVRQLAALQGLGNFSNASTEVMSSLNAILHDPSVPKRNRAIAARLMIDFENRLNLAEHR